MPKENNLNSENNLSKNQNKKKPLLIISVLIIFIVSVFALTCFMLLKGMSENNGKQIANQKMIDDKNEDKKTPTEIAGEISSGLIKPVFSASKIRSSILILPMIGSCQRSSASTPTIR